MKQSLFSYIEGYYNKKRPHEVNGGFSPDEKEAEITELLSSLSEAEISILKLVTEKGNCGVLVPEDDTVVLTLLLKGILEKLSDTGTWINWDGAYNNRAYCVPVIITQKYQKAVINNLHKRAL